MSITVEVEKQHLLFLILPRGTLEKKTLTFFVIHIRLNT